MTIPAFSSPRHILAFDSGIGGLGIVRAIRTLCPAASVSYLADTAVFPYGEQDDAFLTNRIVSLLSDAIRRLCPQAVVVACNTASTLALDALRAACPEMPFIGCVPPIRWAARTTKTHVIGLLATRATTKRPYLSTLQALYAPDCTLISHAAPGLAACAERVFRGYTVPDEDIRAEINGLFTRDCSAELDTVGLGCTHYTFVLDQLRAVSPPGIIWLDPAEAVARHTATILRTLPECAPMPEPARAWFTAEPPDSTALIKALPTYGFDDIALWDESNAPSCLKAASHHA